jgi:hypothetical protein
VIRWLRARRARKMTKKLVTQVQSGVMSVNEARARLNLEPWDFGEGFTRCP